jgi:hypothetical protein
MPKTTIHSYQTMWCKLSTRLLASKEINGLRVVSSGLSEMLGLQLQTVH